MKYITKILAEGIARQLTKPQHDNIIALKAGLSKAVTAIYIASIPPIVLKAFDHNISYFTSCSTIHLIGEGFNHERVGLERTLPYASQFFNIEPEYTDVVRTMLDQISDKELELNKLRKDIEVSLLALRTYKKVQENFPEAYALLPTSESSVPMLDFTKLRSMLIKEGSVA